MGSTHSIVILGGGYLGMYTALHLQRRLRRELQDGSVSITLVSPTSQMTYQPFLPETAAGSLEPRHVVVNLRRTLKHCEFLNGWVRSVNHAQRTLSYESAAGERETCSYDTLVVALGSVTRLLPIPGLSEHGIGMKSVGEAVLLRNHVLRQLDIASSTQDQAVREKALTFTVVGGGFAGIETLAELEDMTRAASALYTTVHPNDVRWVLVEAADKILPELDPDMGQRAVKMLTERGIDVRLSTRLEAVDDTRVRLSDGCSFPSSTLIWTAGVKPNPTLKETDLPLDEHGHLRADTYLRVPETEGVWSAGDCAAVPDLTQPGSFTPPTAQHAVRQAKTLAHNVSASMRGKKLREYKHKNAGSVAGLGLHKGIAQVYGVKLTGWLAWLVHRTYHAMMMPTLNRKFRVISDWTWALFFRRDVVSLGEIYASRQERESLLRSEPHT